jgi:hypothetical protein
MRFGRKRGAQPDESVLDYDSAIILDEEELAEGDIRRAYEEEVLPRLTAYLAEPWQLSEVMDSATPSYAVAAGGRSYAVHGPGIEENSWGRATFALFDIVNRQLAAAPVWLYALNGGNELMGIVLTETEAARAQAALPPRDRPWLPSADPPSYGQPS